MTAEYPLTYKQLTYISFYVTASKKLLIEKWDEVKIKVLKYLKVSDFLKMSVVCRDLYCMSEDQALWRYFLVRDFMCEDVADLVNRPGVSDIIIWKEEYKRRYKSQNTGRFK